LYRWCDCTGEFKSSLPGVQPMDQQGTDQIQDPDTNVKSHSGQPEQIKQTAYDTAAIGQPER